MDKIAFVRLSSLFIALAAISLFHPVLALSHAMDTYYAQKDFSYSKDEQVDLLKTGADAFYAKEYTKTISICNRMIFASPDYAPAYVMKGLAYGAKGELGTAIKNLDRAISIDPNLASAWASKGIVLYSQNNLPDANACIQRAMDIDSNFSIKWNRLAIANNEKEFEPEYHASIAPILIYGGYLLLGVAIGILADEAAAQDQPNTFINYGIIINSSIASDNTGGAGPFSGINVTREYDLKFNTTVNGQRL